MRFPGEHRQERRVLVQGSQIPAQPQPFSQGLGKRKNPFWWIQKGKKSAPIHLIFLFLGWTESESDLCSLPTFYPSEIITTVKCPRESQECL